MELKHVERDCVCFPFYVLIVPYGIETRMHQYNNQHHSRVLIVPYGIETSCGHSYTRFKGVLIVPYGIET